jgi:dipeptidyl aminopeptidase/acylaminoacyl peptidase
MVLSALTTYPDSWAAGVNERGVADFIMHLERTEPQGRRLREIEYGTIGEDGDFLRSISPINHVEKIRAPMVVVHGANDPRVNITVAEALVSQLREYNVPVEYLRFEDEGHGMVRLVNKLRAYPAIADFLDEHLQGDNQ